MYVDDVDPTNPVVGGSYFDTQHMAGALVLACLGFLILIRRGFRGVNVAGVHVGVN